MRSKNLAAFILFILTIDSLFSCKLIMTIGICLFALYLGRYFRVEKKKRVQVKEITDCVSRLKKDMESSIVKQIKVAPLYQILNISTDHIKGKGLANETGFAANLKTDFDKLLFSSNVKCVKTMCI